MKVEPATRTAWAQIELGTDVSLSNNGQLLDHGTVVAKTTSGSALWILSPTLERRMYRSNMGHHLVVEKAPTSPLPNVGTLVETSRGISNTIKEHHVPLPGSEPCHR